MATRGAGQYGYSGDNGLSTVTATLGADGGNVQSGSVIVVGVIWHTNDATATISDAAGNTYTPLTKTKHTTVNEWVQLFYVENATGNAAIAVTVTFTGNVVDRPAIHWREFRGVATSGSFVQEAVGITDPAGMSVTTGTMTASGAGAIFAMGVHHSTGSFVVGTDYTAVYIIASSAGSEDRLISTGGSYTASFTHPSNRNMVLAAALFQDVSGGGTESTVTPTTGLVTTQGRAPTVNAFTAITLRGTMINEAGSPLANLTDLRCLVWYGNAPAGAPDESLSSLTTNANGSYSFALALGGLAFNDPVYRVIYQGDPPTRNHAGRRVPDYE